MAQRSHVDVSGALKKFKDAKRQGPFAIALALTSLAKDGQAAARRGIEGVFDKPTPFTRQAVAIEPATKSRLVSAVLLRPIQARYLNIQISGGVRVAKPGSPIYVPGQIRVNRYGNIPRGRLAAERRKDNTFVSTGNTPRTRHLPPGLYRRSVKRKRARDKAGGAPKALAWFYKEGQYRPIFDFFGIVSREVRRSAVLRFKQAFKRALATAR